MNKQENKSVKQEIYNPALDEKCDLADANVLLLDGDIGEMVSSCNFKLSIREQLSTCLAFLL